MQDEIISLRKVNKIFDSAQGPHHVLKDISFQVNQGEVVAIIGPSGGGKSTCLRTINALESITSGTIKVCGFDYQNPQFSPTFIRRQTAMIFQRFELFSHLNALENVSLGPIHVLKKSKKESLEIAHNLLKKVGLEQHVLKYPKNLSGGQQQRVAVARALSVNPKVLLCDEPTSALDPELVHEIMNILIDIASEGMTMIIVTHEMSFAKKVSHKTLFLENGTIAEQGQTQKLFEQPESERLKQFLSNVSHKY